VDLDGQDVPSGLEVPGTGRDVEHFGAPRLVQSLCGFVEAEALTRLSIVLDRATSWPFR